MPLKTKPTSPNAGARGYGAALRLIAREPHLADAARVEARLATLYGHIADLRPEPEGPRWRQAAHLSRAIADSLATLAEAAGRPRHHPRPTRIRVATLNAADLEETLARVESLCITLPPDDPSAAGPCTVALSDLVTQEGRAVLAPLVRIIAVAPTSGLFALWQQAAARRRVLRSLGVEGEPDAWPDPPRRPGAARRARNGHVKGEGSPLRNGTWTTTGRVERVHLARRAGTVRTEEGQTVFICARVVAGGLNALKPGDAVRLKLRRGPLGVMAVGVEPCPPTGPKARRKTGPEGPSTEV
jgi:cold shock CspA family protein